MNIIGDEHVSPKIVRAVREIALRRTWTLEHVIGSAYRSRPDEDWIAAFAHAGGHVFLSADRDMLRRPTLLAKISQLDLIGIYLPAQWAEARKQYQAAHILYWWPEIERVIETCQKGTAWIVPKGLGSGELRLHVERRGNNAWQQKRQG
ncbi:hypothetical protein [Sinorhizobium sp. BJ1]|uniref:PIN-like domain-containing protein n=1 Tax=Sinorhizobium sp. BJ1 TaxID=2035455 RepID=UPI000BE7C94E|nr:hypothetical protein [Sinorhizobium sp. BJ1]PDT82956.1 hypothetical protein CO676_15410 [Sinorhizobium sp. BJ1]